MKTKRILIIDDERPLLESLEMFLTEKEYAVRCAVTAEEGIRQCAIFDPHVIVLDIRLPDMNGLDVLQELVRSGRRNIIIITAFHDMDTTIKAVKFGAFDYIPKPIDVEELDSAIEKALKTSGTVVMDCPGYQFLARPCFPFHARIDPHAGRHNLRRSYCISAGKKI